MNLEKIKFILICNALDLIKHPFGNYIIQNVVKYWKEKDFVPVLQTFENNYIELSMDKYASNAIEYCLYKKEGMNQFIKEICSSKRIYGN